MLKPISRLRSTCKGDLNYHTYSNVIIHNRINKKILHSIPVLSIFVLLGIITYSTIVIGFGEVDGDVYAETYTDSNTSLIIDNGILNDDATTNGNIVYSSHTVQVKADNIDGYSLTISGPVGLTGGTTITGAGDNTPANMANNSWGYAWDNTTVAEENMTYASFTGSNQTITKTTATAGATNNPSVSSNKIDFTRKLVFAAKFGSDANAGHYKANVNLNLTVTPRALMSYVVSYNMNGGTGGPTNTNGIANGSSYNYTIPTEKPTRSNYSLVGYSFDDSGTVKYPGDTIAIASTNSNITLTAVWQQIVTWGNLSTMQQMTAEACASASVGASKSLTDTRGSTKYTIRKLADGNCWMTTNLTLDLSVKGRATAAASDNLAADFPAEALPNRWATTSEESPNVWEYDNTYTLAQFSKAPKKLEYNDDTPYQTSYGYYYSWCAATAGTCSGVTKSGDDALGSICPKGWRLPKGGSRYDGNNFQTLYDKYVSEIGTSTDMRILLGASSESAGGTYFPVAGSVTWDGLGNAGAYMGYWSRTVYNTNRSSYALVRAILGGIDPRGSQVIRNGASVRCVAYSS